MGIFANLSTNRKINRKIMEIDELDERLHKAERTIASLDLEMSAVWSKVRHALGRVDKRAAIIESEQGAEGAEAATQDGDAPDALGLTPKQREWQRAIQRERGRSA